MASQLEGRPSRLLSLPAELVAWISDKCSDDELLNLRLACRDLAKISRDAFHARFFSSRYTMLADATSMRNLCQVTEDPHLCRHVKHLRFSAAALLLPAEDDRQRLEEVPELSLYKSRRKEFQAVHERLSQAADDYLRAHSRRDMQTVLQNLIDNKADAPFISVVYAEPNYETRDVPPAHKRLSSLLGYDRCLARDSKMGSGPFNIVLSAIGQKQYPVERLALGAPNHCVHLAVFLSSSAFNAATLRDLRLMLRSGHPDALIGKGLEDESDWDFYANLLMDKLVEAKNLETLVLEQSSLMARRQYQNVILQKFIQKAKKDADEFLPRLKVFRFNGLMEDPGLVYQFQALKAPMLSVVTCTGLSRANVIR